MKSGEAFGWLIADLLNRHIVSHWYTLEGEEPEEGEDLADRDVPYCPKCCGPCAAWAEWFVQNKGVTDTYTRHLPDRNWVWMKADGGINWTWVEANMSRRPCPNHEKRDHGADDR